MTWAEIQAFLNAMRPADLKGPVDSDNAKGAELELYSWMVNEDLGSRPHKFAWQLVKGTITLNSTGEYDLETLLPGFGKLYQVYGDPIGGRILTYEDLFRYNAVEGGVRMSLRGNTLLISGATSGTVTVLFYSKYFVADSSGTRKERFEADDDVTLIPNNRVLIDGMLEFMYLKSGGTKAPGQLVNKAAIDYERRVTQLILDDTPLENAVSDFR